MASSVLTVEDVCEEYGVATSNPLDAEYLLTLQSPFCPSLTRCYSTSVVNKLHSAVKKKALLRKLIIIIPLPYSIKKLH